VTTTPQVFIDGERIGGFMSLTENLVMIAIAVWMFYRHGLGI
jgi:glutaredoxin-related protein